MGRTLQAQGQTGEIGLAKGKSRVLERRELPSQPTWMSAPRANNPSLELMRVLRRWLAFKVRLVAPVKQL